MQWPDKLDIWRYQIPLALSLTTTAYEIVRFIFVHYVVGMTPRWEEAARTHATWWLRLLSVSTHACVGTLMALAKVILSTLSRCEASEFGA